MEDKNSNCYKLFFGPYPSPYFGQSIAFKSIFDQYGGKKLLVDYNRYKWAFFSTPMALVKAWFYLFFYPVSKVYLTTSRSTLGFIRDFLVINIASLINVEIINHLHGADFKEFYHNSKYKSIIKSTYNKIDTSVLLLDSMKDQYDDFPDMKMKVISNSADKSLEHVELDLKSYSPIHILYLSNIIYSKGILEYLDAAESILKLNKNIIFHIAGDFVGDEIMSKVQIKKVFNFKYQQLKNTYKDCINYHGQVLGNDKISLLKKSSIFCLPTYYKTEAFPISILEAYLFENAVITTKFNCIEDIVTEANGVLIDIKNSDQIEDSIFKLISDLDKLKSIQKRNRKLYFDKYSNKVYVEKLTELINE